MTLETMQKFTDVQKLESCCRNNIPPATTATPAQTAQIAPNRNTVHQLCISLPHINLLKFILHNTSPTVAPVHPMQRTHHIDNFSQSAFEILQLNCNGLRGKIVEIVNACEQHYNRCNTGNEVIVHSPLPVTLISPGKIELKYLHKI